MRNTSILITTCISCCLGTSIIAEEIEASKWVHFQTPELISDYGIVICPTPEKIRAILEAGQISQAHMTEIYLATDHCNSAVDATFSVEAQYDVAFDNVALFQAHERDTAFIYLARGDFVTEKGTVTKNIQFYTFLPFSIKHLRSLGEES